MLPLGDQWYRRLLLAALLLGAVGGIFALVYSGVTDAGINLLFGAPTPEPFSGQWWWIPLIAAAALLVAWLRERGGVTGKVPGAVAFAQRGWVEPGTAPALVIISAVSLFFGASLGPSFGIIVSAGGFAAWLVTRQQVTDQSARQETALAGMAGGLGAIFAAPLFAAIMASELSPTPKRDYVAAFIPQFSAATVGYIIFFGISGKALLDEFEIEGYTFEWVHLLMGLGLGLLSVLVILSYGLIGKAVERVRERIASRYLAAVVFGALVGAIAFMLPLTATSGSAQLAYQTDHLGELGVALLVVVLVGKVLAVHLSLGAGFLGGTVFPMLFIGGTAGVIVHGAIPDVPAGLAVASMIAAVPGAIIGAPVSFVLIGVGTVGLGVGAIAPIAVAVVTAHIAAGVIEQLRASDKAKQDAGPSAGPGVD